MRAKRASADPIALSFIFIKWSNFRRQSLAYNSDKMDGFNGINLKMFENPITKSKTSLVPKRNLAAASTAEQYSCEFGSSKYYALCGLGGILSLWYYTHIGNAFGFSKMPSSSGAGGLFLGWAPTAIGYSAQGLCKFGFYEVFKNVYSGIMGDENTYLYRTSLYLISSASAEFFADIALSPMESCKVRIQTSAVGTFPTTLRGAFPKILKEEGVSGFYKSLGPLWGRQIPYTMMKFACFERTVEAIYEFVVPKPRSECSKGEQLIVTFAAGYIAGIFCAIVSHPADTIVSYMNKAKGSTVGDAARTLGFSGMWAGLGPRIIMIVSLRLPRPPPPQMPESLKKKSL
ncbi:SLC25A3 [Lepeophtheirus salmonis]|uniref:SLC25A3 n=1 Tax=Lepeophtheirus salmonis TaxID=72036 RepID=A0A7R8D1Y8_LEPSM|nr:SLC25A3 [Lepeophtheirus salmonis]CAF3000536.1 SLC25A3 [Lepeophtheirus salmonis]